MKRLILTSTWLATVLSFGVVLPACTSGRDTSRDSYAAAREYFYGSELATGYLVSSWPASSREERLRLRRAGLGLDESWAFVSEDLVPTDLGDFEYFFRYTVHFENKKTGELFVRKESYYSIGDELWDPVPLTTESSFLKANGRGVGSPVVKALWRCDFDGFLDDRDIDCVRREPAREP